MDCSSNAMTHEHSRGTRQYRICGRSSPGQTLVYEGQFERQSGQADIITALAVEFAAGNLQELIAWFGGDSLLTEVSDNDVQWEFTNDGAVFEIRIDDVD